MTTTEKIIAYFEEHPEDFRSCIASLDLCTDFLCDDRYYGMYDLDDMFAGQSASYVLDRAFYGYDEEDRHKDSSGNTIYGAFNPRKEYFKFDGYGNLISTNHPDYSSYLTEETVRDMRDHRGSIHGIGSEPELSELFDKLETE